MIRTMVQLTEEQLKELKELAKARKTSVASLVRESVTQYVAEATREADREEKWRRALEFLDYIKDHPDEFREPPLGQIFFWRPWVSDFGQIPTTAAG